LIEVTGPVKVVEAMIISFCVIALSLYRLYNVC
jgi:hypothetical protein